MIRLCLDLNVLVADFLADAKGRQDTLAQRLVDACYHGWIGHRRVELVTSLPMVNRFAEVLVREFKTDPTVAVELAEVVADISRAEHVRPSHGSGPLLILGGTQILPMRDLEDRYVLEAAIAGRADYLVTDNMRDFVPPATWLQEPDAAEYGSLVILKPRVFAQLVAI